MRMRGGTRRDPSRRTDGGNVAAFAAFLHTPLLPWQRYVADVAGEIDPDTGSYYYDTVILSTQRQCGKSTLIDTASTRNALWGPRRYVYYLAQTGKDASEHFKKYLAALQDSELQAICRRPYLGAGDLRQPFLNGSVFRPMSVTKVAGHGVQGDMITLDEAFSLSADTGDAIIDGFLPTTATRLKATGVQPQLWITSTEGTAESTFFNSRLDACRTGEASRRTCWFDFGIPDDADPEDLDVIMAYHPAAGLLWNKSQLADFRAQFGQNVSGWARAFGNRRDTGIADRFIPADLWEATVCEPMPPTAARNAPKAFGMAVDVDATHTSISVAVRGDDGVTRTQVLKVLDGTGDAVAELRRLARTYDAPVCMDSRGPNAALHDMLERTDDVRLVPLTSADYMAVGQSYLSGLQNGVVLHAADARLDESAANCARSWSGDSWHVTRRGSTGLTSPIESVMVAAWAVNHAESGELQIF